MEVLQQSLLPGSLRFLGRGDRMAESKLGKQTLIFKKKAVLLEAASIVGPKEGKGPLAEYFDLVLKDDLLGKKSWEKAEQQMMIDTIRLALQKAQLTEEQVDYFLAGDLLNQIITASFSARELQIPFLGVYGACTTIIEALALGTVLIEGGFGDLIVAASSSHNCTAERQYRAPTELGVQLTPTAQCTVTGAGVGILASKGKGPLVTHATIGRVIDLGIKDPSDMGTAMAPAAADTLLQHFQDTSRKPDDYDLILTGDLAQVGSDILRKIMENNDIPLGNNYNDGGIMIFDKKQGVNSGGSGCGCIASTLCGYVYKELLKGTLKKVLLVGTGALLSPTSYQQKESIPGIAHAIALEYCGKEESHVC